MAVQKADRRVQKTLQQLHGAFVQLLNERNYDSILVQDILDRANVGRSTFYTHFRDKDELLMSSIGNLQTMLRQAQSLPLPPSAKSYERIISFSYAMFEHSNDFRKVYQALSRSQAGPLVMQTIRKTIAGLMMDEFRKELQRTRKRSSDVPLEIFIHYLASTFISVLTWWLDRKPLLSPKNINEIFRSLVIPTLAAHFD